MSVTHIPFSNTGYFSKIILDYLEQKEDIKPFYNHFPNKEGFEKQIAEKENQFPQENRNTLVTVLKNQYKNVKTSTRTSENINLLLDKNTFTVTTGHQLSLFTGPLYFLYKIISTINLTEELKKQFPEKNFVPVYWMATEDHDFNEINFFNFKGTKVVWNQNENGAVGRFSTRGLDKVLEEFSKHLGTSKNADNLKILFKKAYLENNTLSAATRYLVNELFGKYGLVILDADEVHLKQQFSSYLEKELTDQTSFEEVSKTAKSLETRYKIQANPREINLFYLTKNSRERIIKKGNQFLINNTALSFSESEILKELKAHPKKFSPNVIMRPLYQEVILPNLCYIGGGGELAYWFELKSYFEKVSIPFPILLLRNSVLVISDKQQKKLSKLQLLVQETFLKEKELLSKKIKENTEIQFNFKQTKKQLETHFSDLKKVAEQTDVSFIGAVNAQEKRQIKGLENLKKRLLKAEKRKHADLVNRIIAIQNELFPNGGLEERQRNFSEYYLEYGEEFIKELLKELNPLQLEFTVVKI